MTGFEEHDLSSSTSEHSEEAPSAPLIPPDTEPIWGEDFFKTYLAFADQTSKDNQIMNTAGMYCLVGQAMRNVVIRYRGNWADGRISTLVIQESGTGKDSAFDFCKLIADASGFRMRTIGSVTTAGLVGSVDKSGNPIYGAAYDSDIIGFKEANTIFLTAMNEHSSDLINYLNQILDKGGHIYKQMARGVVEYDTRASLFGTTYPPRDGIKYIPEGFMPRLMICFRTIDKEYHDRITKWMIDSLGEPIDGDKQDIFRVAATVSLLKQSMIGEYFTYPEKEVLGEIASMMSKIMGEYDEDLVDYARPFVQRSLQQCVKIATYHAAVDKMSKAVTTKHFKQASAYIKMVWTGTLDFIDKYRPFMGDKIMGRVEASVRALTADGKVAALRDVLRRTHVKKYDLMIRLLSLEEMGLIKIENVKNQRGAPTMYIKWIGYAEAEKEGLMGSNEPHPT